MIGKAAKKVLIPLGVGIAVALAAGVKGVVDIVKGRGIRKAVLKRFNDAISACEATRADTERVAREYGVFQILAH